MNGPKVMKVITLTVILFLRFQIVETHSGKNFIMAGGKDGGSAYFRAVSVNGLVFISGQQGVEPKDSTEKPEDSSDNPSANNTGNEDEETRRKRDCEDGGGPTTLQGEAEIALKNIILIVEEAGGTADDIMTMRIYLRNLGDYGNLKNLLSKVFTENPALTVVEVPKLTNDAKITIDAIAVLEST